MKKTLLSLLLVFTASFYLNAQAKITSLALTTGIPVALKEMKDVSGKGISLNKTKKQNGLLVMFSCNTCPYVIKNQERTKEICNYALKNNIGVILINSNEALRDKDDSFEAMKAYAKEQDYQWPYVVDTKSAVADVFGATRTPEVFLFDKNDNLAYKGAIDDNPQDAKNVNRLHLKEAIDEQVAGKQITVKESRSVGCTIKRVS